MIKKIRKGEVYTDEQVPPTVRTQLNGYLRTKAAEKAKASAELRSKAQRDIYIHQISYVPSVVQFESCKGENQ